MDKKNEQDILNLPPRSKVHSDEEKKKKKVKIKYPLLPFLLICFLLVPISVFYVYIYYLSPMPTEKKGYELVNVQQNAQQPKIETATEKQPEKKENKKEQENKGEENKSREPIKSESYTLHTVVAGETLYSISMKYYQTRDGESYIRNLNGLSTNEVAPGQLLKIPPKSEVRLK